MVAVVARLPLACPSRCARSSVLAPVSSASSQQVAEARACPSPRRGRRRAPVPGSRRAAPRPSSWRMVRVATSRVPICTTASWLRYSAAANHQALPRAIGPPSVAGVLLAVERRSFRACGRRWPAGPAARRRAGRRDAMPPSVSLPAARHHVHGRGRRPALLGREAVGRDLELLDGVLRQVGERTAHHVVVVVLPVDRDVAAAAELARGGDRHDCSSSSGRSSVPERCPARGTRARGSCGR